MGLIGHLYGLETYVNENCTETRTHFTKKQTRKFTNTRWVKKYKKKYSYDVQVPAAYRIGNKLVIHPKIYEAVRREIDQQDNSDHMIDSIRYMMEGIRGKGICRTDHSCFGRSEGTIQGNVRPRISFIPTFGMGQGSLISQPCA